MEKLDMAFASQLVLEAIKSGSIKLHGSTRSSQLTDATLDAAVDAAYLLKLMTDLVDGSQKPS